jgi:hypothetical protein
MWSEQAANPSRHHYNLIILVLLLAFWTMAHPLRRIRTQNCVADDEKNSPYNQRFLQPAMQNLYSRAHENRVSEFFEKGC